MNEPMGFAELMASTDQLNYNILRTTPDSGGEVMSHDDIKSALNLPDGRAELLRAKFNSDVSLNSVEG